VKAVIFNLTGIEQMGPWSFKPFVSFVKNLKAGGTWIASFGASRDVQKQIMAAGTQSVFNIQPSLEDALIATKVKEKVEKVVVDVPLLQAFLDSIQGALEFQAGLKVTRGKPKVISSDDVLTIDIVGVMGVKCPSFTGNVSICFPAATFLALYLQMTDSMTAELNDEMNPAIVELLDVMLAGAKNTLNGQRQYVLSRTSVQVLQKGQIKDYQSSRGQMILMPITTNLGEFHVEMSLGGGNPQ
jgi:CheY-specific phosphatase CheX